MVPNAPTSDNQLLHKAWVYHSSSGVGNHLKYIILLFPMHMEKVLEILAEGTLEE
jgi:hypothetical protein